MNELNKTQKIVIFIIGAILVILIIIYFFTKDNTIYSDYTNLYNEENVTSNNEISDEENMIKVYVCGEVNNPSVVYLKEGAIVNDAIEKAGGLTDSGEIKDLNLAYKLKDGQRLYIPSLDEVIESKESDKIVQYISESVTSSENQNTRVENISSDVVENDNKNLRNLVNINTATQTELETLDGIGPSIAKKIVEYRKTNGKFKAIEDIKEVPGIGEAKYEAISGNICV